jgi:hypothetical protein
VHHKDEDWQNNSLDNLERLCRLCHKELHSKFLDSGGRDRQRTQPNLR